MAKIHSFTYVGRIRLRQDGRHVSEPFSIHLLNLRLNSIHEIAVHAACSDLYFCPKRIFMTPFTHRWI